MLTAQSDFSLSFATILSPLSASDTSVNSSSNTIKNIDAYNKIMVELKESLIPELELIDTRILAPLKEFQEVLKKVKKAITKRDHKVGDAL
jgi:amphiphysin